MSGFYWRVDEETLAEDERELSRMMSDPLERRLLMAMAPLIDPVFAAMLGRMSLDNTQGAG